MRISNSRDAVNVEAFAGRSGRKAQAVQAMA
jgi:hypothetical protein